MVAFIVKKYFFHAILISTEEIALFFLPYHFLFSSGSSAQAILMMFKTKISNDTVMI